MSQITLHHLNNSRSERIVWLLEELGVPYEIKVHYRTKMGLAPDTLKEVSPLGKAPVLVVDGKTYIESGAIVHYLLKNFPGAGLEHDACQDSVMWSHFSEGSMMLFLQSAFTISRGAEVFGSRGIAGTLFGGIVGKFAAWYTGYAKDNVDAMLGEVERWFDEHRNFSGGADLGEGDFMMIYPLNSIANGTRKGRYTMGPKTAAYVERMLARPGWQRATKRIADDEKAQKDQKEPKVTADDETAPAAETST